MSASIIYNILKGSLPVTVVVTNIDVDPPYVFPDVEHDDYGTYEYTGLLENTNYDITFTSIDGCVITYKFLMKTNIETKCDNINYRVTKGFPYLTVNSFVVGDKMGDVFYSFNPNAGFQVTDGTPKRCIIYINNTKMSDTNYVCKTPSLYNFGGLKRTEFIESFGSNIDPDLNLPYPIPLNLRGGNISIDDGYPIVYNEPNEFLSFNKNQTYLNLDVHFYVPLNDHIYDPIFGVTLHSSIGFIQYCPEWIPPTTLGYGLVSCWEFDSTGTIIDSQNNVNIPIGGGVTEEQRGKINYSYLFDGTVSPYIENSSTLSVYNNDTITISTWFGCNEISDEQWIFRLQGEDGDNLMGIRLKRKYIIFPQYGMVPYFYLRDVDGNSLESLIGVGQDDTDDIIDEFFHNICVTINKLSDRYEVNIYLDGKYIKTRYLYSNAAITPFDKLYLIGSNSTDNTFRGYLDQTCYWNRILSEDEIVYLNNNMYGRHNTDFYGNGD